MFDWIKNIGKEVPEFWKVYNSKFDVKSDRFVVISCETSGSNAQKDAILSVAGIAVINDSILINDSFEIKINYDNEITKHSENSHIQELNPILALQEFVNFIGNAKLIGFRINFETELINEMLSKLHCGKLKNEVFDLEVMHKKYENIIDDNFTLNELFTIYKMQKSDRNSAATEALNMALLFLKLKARLNI